MTRLALLALAVAGCVKDPPPAAAAKPEATTAKPKAVTAKPKPAAKPKPEVAAKTTPKKKRTKGGKAPIKWPQTIEWKSWADAQTISAETGKPICLVVYADWCPRCKELAPAFEDADVKALTDKMVMVLADNDAKPAYLQPLAEHGGYVPRIFFFDQAGQVRTDVTSGHPRYPFFYTPRNLEALKAAMTSAIGGA